MDAKATLPPDEQAFGFENNAEALSMQPALLDRRAQHGRVAVRAARDGAGIDDLSAAAGLKGIGVKLRKQFATLVGNDED